MAKRPCSELAATVTQLAMHVGARPDVKSLADVVTHLEKELPGITREILVNSINEATTGHRAAKDALQKKLADLRREARTDVSLRRAAVAMEQHVKGGTRPAPVAKKASPKEIQEVREKIRGLRQQLATSDPKAREKVKARIAELDALIAKGESPKPRERKAAPADLQALRDERDAKYRQAKTADPAAREAVRAQIRAIEKHLADETFPDKAERPTAPADLQKLRDERDALAAELRRNDPKIRQDIQQQIAELEGHLKAGTLPQPPAAKADNTPADVLALREARDNLQSALAKSEPALREKYQKQIDDLTQRLEDGVEVPGPKVEPLRTKELDRLTFERDRLRSKIRTEINALRPKSLWGHVAANTGEVLGLSRAIKTSLDLSAVLRQGAFIALGHPIRAARAFPAMFRAMANEATSHAIHQEILKRENAPLYDRHKLFLSEEGGATSKAEEAFMSKWLDKAQESKIGKLATLPVQASQRAYTTFLNRLRADSFDAMANGLSQNGMPTSAQLDAIANYINVATGRGTLGKKLEQAAPALNAAFFAPRYVASRFQLLFGQPLYGGDLATRKMIGAEYARFLGGLGVVYGLGLAAGGTVETDARSSDFGKIRFGNARLDPLAGLAQASVFSARMLAGSKVSVDGKEQSLSTGKYGQPSRESVAIDFARSKASPAVGVLWDWASGKKLDRKTPFTVSGALKDLTLPMSYENLIDSFREQGIPRGSALSILSTFGMGVQHYDK